MSRRAAATRHLPTAPSPRWHARVGPWLALAACAALASLWLRQGFPAHAVADALFDDALFVRLAYALGSGRWLGDFDRLTLAKGMAYPLFMALSAALAVPLKLAEHLLYLGVSGALALAVARRLGRPGLGFALFAALAFNPVLWHPELARVIREGLYLSQSLALIGLCAWLLHPRTRGRPAWCAAVLAGLVLAGYWSTREEGVWLLPALGTMAGAAVFSGLWRRHRAVRRHPRLAPGAPRVALRPLVPLLLAGLVGLLGVTAVKVVNHARYGVFVATEFQDERFQRAYGALARIRHDQWRPYVVFPADARERAYAASAAARELRPAFEGENGRLWREAGCRQTETTDCPEVLSGWFMWALRDAVWLAGHYDSAPRALAFYERLAEEINGACDVGHIPCEAPRHTLAPAFRAERLRPTAEAALAITRLLAQLGDGRIGTKPSLGAAADLVYIAQMVGRIAPPAAEALAVTGRFDPAGVREALPSLHVTDPQGEPAALRTETEAIPGQPGLLRVRLFTDCLLPGCTLHAGLARGALQPGQTFALPQGMLRLEDLRLQTQTVEGRRTHLQVRLAALLARIQAWLWPVLAVLALFGWAGAGLRWLRGAPGSVALGWPWLLASGALAAVATRIALLAYLEATSIPAVKMLYASPAAPLVIVFTVMGLMLGALSLGKRE